MGKAIAFAYPCAKPEAIKVCALAYNCKVRIVHPALAGRKQRSPRAYTEVLCNTLETAAARVTTPSFSKICSKCLLMAGAAA